MPFKRDGVHPIVPMSYTYWKVVPGCLFAQPHLHLIKGTLVIVAALGIGQLNPPMSNSCRCEFVHPNAACKTR
jgi:hypothetical protein